LQTFTSAVTTKL